MDIWLDTTNIRMVEKAVRCGLLAGVTTNPSLIAQSQQDFEKILEDLLHHQEGPVTAQVVSDDVSEMVQQGQNLHSLSNRLIIKVPVTKNGFEAIHLLARQGIPTMATAVFHLRQALIAAKAGADYVAPYLGHLEKMGGNPWEMLENMQNIFHIYRLKTKVLGASLDSMEQVIRCAELGIYGVTIKDELFENLIADDAITLKRVDRFAMDWKKVETPLMSL